MISNYRLSQKELRLLKREVNLTIQTISKNYITQRVKVGKTFGWSLARGFLGRKSAGSFGMIRRNSITLAKDNALRPYRQINSFIDDTILELDKYKSNTETWLLENKTPSS